MTPLDLVLSKLQGVERQPNGSHKARCPAHEDAKASLSITEGGGGKVLVKCFAGCQAEAVVAALGLGMKDLFPKEPKATRAKGSGFGRIVATYDYVDEQGRLLYQTVRLDPKDFRQRRPIWVGDAPADGEKPAGWAWSLGAGRYRIKREGRDGEPATWRKLAKDEEPKDGDREMGAVRLVLYRLPQLLALAPERTVTVAEGEKDCDNLRRIGIVATCNPMGAGKWRDEYGAFLKGRKIVVVADKDEPGRKHAEHVCASAKAAGATSVKLLELPGDSVKDASDWIAAGWDAPAFVALVKGAPEWEAPKGVAEKLRDIVEAGKGENEKGCDFAVGVVRIFTSVPPVYEMAIDGRLVRFDADDVLVKGRFVRKVMQVLNRIVKVPMKPGNWRAMVNRWLARAERVEMPEEASTMPALDSDINAVVDDLQVGEVVEELRLGRAVLHKGRKCFQIGALEKGLRNRDRIVGRHTLCQRLRVLGFRGGAVRFPQGTSKAGVSRVKWVWAAPESGPEKWPELPDSLLEDPPTVDDHGGNVKTR